MGLAIGAIERRWASACLLLAACAAAPAPAPVPVDGMQVAIYTSCPIGTPAFGDDRCLQATFLLDYRPVATERICGRTICDGLRAEYSGDLMSPGPVLDRCFAPRTLQVRLCLPGYEPRTFAVTPPTPALASPPTAAGHHCPSLAGSSLTFQRGRLAFGRSTFEMPAYSLVPLPPGMPAPPCDEPAVDPALGEEIRCPCPAPPSAP